jgi:hypothetical protein
MEHQHLVASGDVTQRCVVHGISPFRFLHYITASRIDNTFTKNTLQNSEK